MLDEKSAETAQGLSQKSRSVSQRDEHHNPRDPF